MLTPRTDLITLFNFAKCPYGGSNFNANFKSAICKLTAINPMDNDRLHGAGSTIGQQLISHDETRYYCDVNGYKIPADILEPASLVSLKEQLLRLTKNEAANRGYLTKLVEWLDEEYIPRPGILVKPPHGVRDIFEEVLIVGMNCSKPTALIAADKLAESDLHFKNCADYLLELGRQLREGGNYA